MSNILINNNFYISTPSACIVDLTPPTFAGINFADVESRGQIRVAWAAGTDVSNPIRYEVYIQASTAVGLFNFTNITAMTPNLQYDIFSLPDGSFLQNGTTYYIGVRAVDAVGNRDSNTISLNKIATGILTSIDIFGVKGAFSGAPGGNFQGTIWGMINGELATSSNSVLGTASYQVYDKDGNTISGLSESGIAADSNGQYQITPVSSTLDDILNHYLVKVTINIDGEDRVDYISIVEKSPSYSIAGQNAFDNNGDFTGVFWAEDESRLTINDLARLGNGSYDVLDESGNIVSGFSETGIVPNSQGMYVITPVSGISTEDLVLRTGRVTVSVDGKDRTTYIPINVGAVNHSVKATFSINALNQFQATFWVATSLGMIKTTSIGAANYTVYDSSGVAVSGLSQSGITADVNGRFQINPVSAILLTDLTHYSVKVGVIVDGIEHVSYKGFTLLGT